MGFSDEKLKGLLKKMQNGEGIERERATGEFLKFYYPIMKGYFHGCFGMINKEEVEDFCQNILLRIIKNKINIKNNVKGYLYFAAKNIFLTYIVPKYKPLFFEELSETLQVQDSIYYPGVLVDYKIKEEIFYEKHRKLRKKSVKTQFQMALQGIQYPEIARRLNISKESVKSNVCRVRAKEGAIFFEEPNQKPYGA
mgnify:CR=1 FL=1